MHHADLRPLAQRCPSRVEGPVGRVLARQGHVVSHGVPPRVGPPVNHQVAVVRGIFTLGSRPVRLVVGHNRGLDGLQNVGHERGPRERPGDRRVGGCRPRNAVCDPVKHHVPHVILEDLAVCQADQIELCVCKAQRGVAQARVVHLAVVDDQARRRDAVSSRGGTRDVKWALARAGKHVVDPVDLAEGNLPQLHLASPAPGSNHRALICGGDHEIRLLVCAHARHLDAESHA